MAVYCKPSYNEPLTVFNPANWICGENNDGTSNTGGISLAYANANFLKFPSAQGNETLVGINVLGTSQFNGTLNEFTNQADFNGTANFNSGIRLNTGSLRFPDATLQTSAYTGTASVASNVVVNSGGSASMYLALTQGTGGNFPIQTNIPTYDATSLVLTAPIFNGTTYITSPLLTTSPNGTVRIASTTGQYSSLQQSSVGLGNDLNLTVPSAGLFRVITNGTAILPSANAGTGLAIGWNSTNGDGATDFINYAQGSPTGGFYFYNVSNATNSALIGRIPSAQPAFGDTSTTSIPTNSWVNGTISAGGFAKLASANTFTAQNTFDNLCPQTPIAPTVNNSLTNKLYVDTSISNAIIGSGSASLGGANVFTAQNTFNNFAPETPIAPTVNNSLVNLQYLNTQIASLRSQIPLRAVESFSPLSGDYINTLTINSWANYLVNEFITIRYTLSNNYPYTDTITASTNTANSTGYVDIYPYRLGFGNGAPIAQVLNFNVINNTLNGSSAYNMNSTQLRGRWFWAYNQSNLNAPANGFYLYIQNITSQVLDIGLYVASPSPGNPYSTSFTVELVSSIDSSKITTSNFNVSNF